MFRKILVPIDETAASMRALDSAIELAEGTNSTLVVMTVIGKPGGWVSAPAASVTFLVEEATRALEHERKALLDYALSRVHENTPCMRVLDTGEPGERILHQLESDDYDLVVIGSRGLHGVSASVLGSVSKQVLRKSMVPVMIVHANEDYEDWTPPPGTSPDDSPPSGDDA